MEYNKCCKTALRYTKLSSSSTTPVLEDTEGNQTATLEDTGAIIGREVFLYQLIDRVGTTLHPSSEAQLRYNEVTIRSTLFNQSQKKALGLNQLQFSAVLIL